MSDNQTLEAAPSVAQETSAPAADVKQEVVNGEIENAPKDEGKVEEKATEAKPEPTEAEKKAYALQKRIDRQTAASKALQEQNSQLKAQLEQLAAKAPKPDDAPKQDDFDSYEEWHKATVKYEAKLEADNIIKQAKEQELKVVQEQQARETRRQLDEKEAAFRTISPDYDIVLKEASETLDSIALQGINIAPFQQMVLNTDNPPQVIYELGKNPELIESLVNMSPLKAMREIIKMEIALEGTKKEVVSAPEPIKRLSATGKATKALDEMTFEERNKYFSKK